MCQSRHYVTRVPFVSHLTRPGDTVARLVKIRIFPGRQYAGIRLIVQLGLLAMLRGFEFAETDKEHDQIDD